MKYNYIAIEGAIGAGKTTLARMIADTLNGKAILEEFENNTFLEKFYQNMERYAFPLEVSFLVERFQQLHVHLAEPDLFQKFFISDYFFDKSIIFGQMTLTADKYTLFRKLFETFQAQIPRPDLIIYLYSNIERLQENIAQRGRAFESKITYDYLDNLQKSYLSYLRSLNNQSVLLLDATDIDFVVSENTFQLILNLIEKDYKPGITTIKFK